MSATKKTVTFHEVFPSSFASSKMQSSPPTFTKTQHQQYTNNSNSNISSNSNMSATKKTVTFHECVRVKKTIHINNYTDDEIDACWFSRQDMANIRQDIAAALQSSSSSPSGPDAAEMRGLECRTEQGSQQRRRDRHESLSSVLDEQELQRHERQFDDEMIAAVYSDTTQQAQLRASVAGMLDYQVAYWCDRDRNHGSKAGKQSSSQLPASPASSSMSMQRIVLQSNPRSVVVHRVASMAA
eukprot:CAMPEP_0119571400 /NCGR_PEP_ID=MMETSP1352-20130426/44101_1 /TAXON_ID=265584 /ORGANISM="Stauroneis constricta, Strain CCMP1120" /LENGTH=240 /DNA_ID=CAMNT_0007621079 /DNA_START=397 /DNA_END=1119 /DNA_ORIENTATION=-